MAKPSPTFCRKKEVASAVRERGTKDERWARREEEGGGRRGWMGRRMCWARESSSTPQALTVTALPPTRLMTGRQQQVVNTKNKCDRMQTRCSARSAGRRDQSGFKTEEEATKAMKETTATPSQESIMGIRKIYVEIAKVS